MNKIDAPEQLNISLKFSKYLMQNQMISSHNKLNKKKEIPIIQTHLFAHQKHPMGDLGNYFASKEEFHFVLISLFTWLMGYFILHYMHTVTLSKPYSSSSNLISIGCAFR